MPTDAERFRFLAEHQLCVTWYDNGASISWRERRPPPGRTAGYMHLSRGGTLAAAVDSVIARWKRKHGFSELTAPAQTMVVLEVRGWVS